MEEAAVALMEAEAVEGGSTAAVGEPLTGAEACALVEEAGHAGDLIRLPLPVTEVHALHLLMLRALVASTQRAPATPIPGQAAISRAALSGLEIPRLRQMVLPTASGIPLAAHLEAADLRARSRKQGPQLTRVDSTPSAEIAERVLLPRRAAFQVRAARFMRMLPQREMSFPGPNRFPLCTIRSAGRPQQVPRSGQTRHSLAHRVWVEGLHSWAIEDFQVA